MKTFAIILSLLTSACVLYEGHDPEPGADAGEVGEVDAGCLDSAPAPDSAYTPLLIICQPHVGECVCSVDAVTIECTGPMLDLCASLDEHSCWVDGWE